MGSHESSVWLGRVFTGTAWAEGLVVEDGRVAAVGPRPAILRESPAGAARHAVRNGCLVPGLVDSHLHLTGSLVARVGVDLRGARSRTEFAERLRRWTETNPVGPIVGGGWDQTQFDDGRWPDRGWIDEVTGSRPAVLDRVCAHVALVTAAGLERLGWDPGTKDPPGGRIGRARSGEPDGLLFESALDALAPLRAGAVSSHETEFRRMLAEWSAWGLTTVADMGTRPEELDTLRGWVQEARFPIELRSYRRLEPGREFRERGAPLPIPGLSEVGVKAHLDGALGARTAALWEPYSDTAGESGLLQWPPEELRRQLESALAGGRPPALHAIGDRAVGVALAEFEALGRPEGARLEHASVLPPQYHDRLLQSGATVVVQPSFRWSDRWLAERLGPVRARWTYAFQTLSGLGVPMAGSSDSPVESADPWVGMRAAVGGPDGSSWPESLDAAAAFALYTTGGSAALREPSLGRLVPGGPADFLELAAPSPARAIEGSGAPVTGTWKEGRRVGPASARSS